MYCDQPRDEHWMTCKFGFQCISSDIQTRQQQLPSSSRDPLKYGLKRQQNETSVNGNTVSLRRGRKTRFNETFLHLNITFYNWNFSQLTKWISSMRSLKLHSQKKKRKKESRRKINFRSLAAGVYLPTRISDTLPQSVLVITNATPSRTLRVTKADRDSHIPAAIDKMFSQLRFLTVSDIKNNRS